MIISRIFSLGLRIAQFITAAIVLGLTSYFLHIRLNDNVGPLGRTIYAVILASFSIIGSLLWMIPSKSSMTSYVSDLVFSAAWFAAFGIMVVWIRNVNCGSIWNWSGISIRGEYCSQWRAAQAFSFLAAIFWFVSFLLGIMVYHRLSKHVRVEESRRSRRMHV